MTGGPTLSLVFQIVVYNSRAASKSFPRDQSKLRQDFVPQSEYNKQKEKNGTVQMRKRTANITQTWKQEFHPSLNLICKILRGKVLERL